MYTPVNPVLLSKSRVQGGINLRHVILICDKNEEDSEGKVKDFETHTTTSLIDSGNIASHNHGNIFMKHPIIIEKNEVR